MHWYARFVHPLILAAALLPISAQAQEAVLESEAIPADAESFKTPSSDIFLNKLPTAETVAGPMDSETTLPPFLSDATLKINARSFYFARQDGKDEPGRDSEKISWALGGSAQLKTGRLWDAVSLGAELFTAQHLYGPEDKDGALLLKRGQEGYTVLGVLNPRLNYGSHVLTLYRQRHDFPYVNNQENRMTPNTFESYSYGYTGQGEEAPLQFGFGYIDRIKKRDSDEFVAMSEAAGVANADRGMPWGGFRVRPRKDIRIVVVNLAGWDFLNLFYSDAEHNMSFGDGWALKSAVQFTEQRSIGDDLLFGEERSAGMWGIQEALSYRGLLLRAALTVNDKGGLLRAPFGSYPGYNSSIVEDFNRAGEIAWKIGLSYDFAHAGVEGLSAYADYIEGDGAVNDMKENVPDKNELDVNVDYRIKQGALAGLWLRFRSGFVHEDTVGTTKDFRIILNYEVPLI